MIFIWNFKAYDTDDSDWSNEISLPEPRFRLAAAASEDTTQVFIFGGQGQSEVRDGQVYYPVSADVFELVEVDDNSSENSTNDDSSNCSSLFAGFISFVFIFVNLL